MRRQVPALKGTCCIIYLSVGEEGAASKDSIASEAGLSWAGFVSSCPWIYICRIPLCASVSPLKTDC